MARESGGWTSVRVPEHVQEPLYPSCGRTNCVSHIELPAYVPATLGTGVVSVGVVGVSLPQAAIASRLAMPIVALLIFMSGASFAPATKEATAGPAASAGLTIEPSGRGPAGGAAPPDARG